jgi:hypothetical protein
MKKLLIVIMLITSLSILPSVLFAIEKAPRISDREIIERLTRLEEGQKNLEKRLDDVHKRIDDLRFEMNKRFDTLQWMFGLFITISLVILGFVLRMQWQMHKRQTRMEAILEAHK